MRVRVQNWGKSKAMRIPSAVARRAGLDQETEAEMTVTQSGLSIERATISVFTLEELVAGITPENTHAEVDFGPPVGKEAW